MSVRLANLIISLSLIEPLGWIIALTPAWINFSIPSVKGKKASEAATEPFNCKGRNWLALLIAILQLSNLFGCPEPIPMVEIFFAITMAFDFTCLQTFNAKI